MHTSNELEKFLEQNAHHATRKKLMEKCETELYELEMGCDSIFRNSFIKAQYDGLKSTIKLCGMTKKQILKEIDDKKQAEYEAVLRPLKEEYEMRKSNIEYALEHARLAKTDGSPWNYDKEGNLDYARSLIKYNWPLYRAAQRRLNQAI